MAFPLIPLALLAGAVFTLLSDKPAPAPTATPGPDPLSGGTGGGALDDETDPVDDPEGGTPLPTLEEEEPLTWDQIVPCATDLKGYVLDAASFSAIGKRSLVVLLTCERESELEAEFHLACAEDDTDVFDWLVLHRDDIDFTDPYNMFLEDILDQSCVGKQGAFGVVHYDPQGPRLLVYDGFEGAANEVLSYPNTTGLDPYDVVSVALDLATDGVIPGIDGDVVEGEEFDALLVEP